MVYERLVITNHAEKQLSKLPPATAKQIIISLSQFIFQPQKANLKKLKGYKNTWRIRVGNYRALFKIENNLVIVIKVGHRKDIYKE